MQVPTSSLLTQQQMVPHAAVYAPPVPTAAPVTSASLSLSGGHGCAMQYAMSAAYDAALAHARSLDIDRRERELEQRLRNAEEIDAKKRFMESFGKQYYPFP